MFLLWACMHAHRILAGEDREFDGELQLVDGLRVGYLEQEPKLDAGNTVDENIRPALAHTQALLDEFEQVLFSDSIKTSPFIMCACAPAHVADKGGRTLLSGQCRKSQHTVMAAAWASTQQAQLAYGMISGLHMQPCSRAMTSYLQRSQLRMQ